LQCAAYITVLTTVTIGLAISALKYAFLWATVALALSGIVSVTLYLTRYINTARELDTGLLHAPDDAPEGDG